MFDTVSANHPGSAHTLLGPIYPDVGFCQNVQSYAVSQYLTLSGVNSTQNVNKDLPAPLFVCHQTFHRKIRKPLICSVQGLSASTRDQEL